MRDPVEYGAFLVYFQVVCERAISEYFHLNIYVCFSKFWLHVCFINMSCALTLGHLSVLSSYAERPNPHKPPTNWPQSTLKLMGLEEPVRWVGLMTRGKPGHTHVHGPGHLAELGSRLPFPVQISFYVHNCHYMAYPCFMPYGSCHIDSIACLMPLATVIV